MVPFLLELPEAEQAEQRNRRSPELFSAQSLIVDPPWNQVENLSLCIFEWNWCWLICQVITCSDEILECIVWFVFSTQQCLGVASYSTMKVVVIVGEWVHRNHLSECLLEPYSASYLLVCFLLWEFFDLALAKTECCSLNVGQKDLFLNKQYQSALKLIAFWGFICPF